MSSAVVSQSILQKNQTYVSFSWIWLAAVLAFGSHLMFLHIAPAKCSRIENFDPKFGLEVKKWQIISKSKFSILVHRDLLVILSINTAFFICAMLFGPSFVISTLGSSLVVVTFCLESFCSIFSFQQHNGREGVINFKKFYLQ